MPPTQPPAHGHPGDEPGRAPSSCPSSGPSSGVEAEPPGVAAESSSLAAADLEHLTDAFLTSSRALVGIALRSVNASPVEVTLMQHRVLVLLASRGEQSVSTLAGQLGVNASNASRVCDRLQRLGLVARRRSTTDARSVKVALTARGLEVVSAVDEHRRAEIRRLLGSLTPESGRHMVEALRTFNEAAHESARADWVVAGSEG